MTWPITNPTFGSYQWLAMSVGLYLNMGADDAAWDEEQAKTIDWLVQRGIWQFYNPPMLPGQTQSYVWSFCKKRSDITVVNGTHTYTLPTDFGGVLLDETTYLVGDTNSSRRIQLIGDHTVRALQAKNDSSGDPLYIAVRPAAEDLTAEQTFEVVVYPTPDAGTANFQVRYKTNHAVLDLTNDFPYGTRSNSECIVQSCLAMAECFANKAPGPIHQMFLQHLTAAIQNDRINSMDGEVVSGIPDIATQATV